MKYYYCQRCDEFVPESDANVDTHTEIHREVDTRSEEEWYTLHCPHCGDELVEEARKCICGEPIRDDGRHLCPDCFDDMETMFEDMRREVHKWFVSEHKLDIDIDDMINAYLIDSDYCYEV